VKAPQFFGPVSLALQFLATRETDPAGALALAGQLARKVISKNSDLEYRASDLMRDHTHRKETTMPTGNVKWFNPAKGFGFIQPQGGGRDVFVHISAVERAGLSTLNEGQVVQYEIVSNRGKESADSLKVG
jgi:CspA family cold shock protein